MTLPRTIKPCIVGVLGGIASGKSLVTRILSDAGAEVLSADAIAHGVLSQENIVAEIVRRFGESVLADHCRPQIDRGKLASMVFGPTEHHRRNRELLEAIVQPIVREQLRSRIDEWKSNPTPPVLVLDIPLLVERDWVKECHHVLFVDTPQEMRVRFASSRGWTQQQLADREANQMNIVEKRNYATYVITNDRTESELREQVLTWLHGLAG